jgi:tetratricopeptide (TPR) repeat protein
VTEALGTDLRKVNGLEVLPRERIVKVRAAIGSASAEPSPAAIGLRLGCRWVMAGSYQTVGDALRITMRLVETATEKTVAMEKIDGALSDLFQMQDQLAAVTLRALDLDGDQRPRPAARPSLSAYESYVRGRRLFLRLEKGSMDQARQYYEDAVRAEPGYALALSGLAGFHAMQYTFTTDVRTLNDAADYAQRSIEADPMLADAWNWLAYAHQRLGRIEEAYTELLWTIKLEPANFLPHYFAGGVGHFLRKEEEALGHLQRAVELEPTLSFPIWALACMHTAMGSYDEALWTFERTAIVDRAAGEAAHWPGHEGFHGECLRRVGRLDEARARCLAAVEDVEKSDHMFRDTNRMASLVALGRTALQQSDPAAARAAFGQAIAHVHGRHRTLAGGTLLVQALAGLARANGDREAYAEAARLDQRRDQFDFSGYWLCEHYMSLLDLSRAADALGLADESRALRQEAAEQGSVEAQRGLP